MMIIIIIIIITMMIIKIVIIIITTTTTTISLPSPRRLGISPCLSVPAYPRIMNLASSNLLVRRRRPLMAMKVSLPQFLNRPVEKWGRPFREGRRCFTFNFIDNK